MRRDLDDSYPTAEEFYKVFGPAIRTINWDNAKLDTERKIEEKVIEYSTMRKTAGGGMDHRAINFFLKLHGAELGHRFATFHDAEGVYKKYQGALNMLEGGKFQPQQREIQREQARKRFGELRPVKD